VLANNFLLGEPIVFAADRVKLADACWTNGDTAGNNDVSFGWAGADGWATHEVLALSAAAPLFVVDSFHFFFGTAYYELRETNAGLGTDPECHYSLTAPRLCRAGADAILQFGQQKGLDCPLVGPVDSATGSGVCGDAAQYDTLDDAASALAANHASGDATCHTITMVSNAARTSVDFVLHASETATPIAPGDDPRTSYTLACPSPPDTPPPSPPPFAPLPAPPPPTTGWFPSELGQSCTDACAANGLICDAGEGRAHMDQIDEASEYDAITATIQFGNVTGTTCTNGHVGLQWSSYPNYRPDGESDGVCGLSGTNPDGSYGYGCPTTAPGFYRICYCISARPAPPPTAPPPPLVPCQVDACTPFANASLAAAHCAAQPAENQCVVTGDDRTAGTRRSRRLSETMPSCPAATQTYTWVLATMARDCNSACAANGNTCVDGATTGNSAACLTEIAASLSPPLTCGHVWDGDASSTMDPSYYPYSGGRCYYSDPSSSSPFTCTGSSSNKQRICPCAPPTPPPALHALVHHTDFQNELRFNENVDRSITLSAESGLKANDAVVYVPTTESTCVNVFNIASDNKHGGLLDSGLAVVVNLQTGQYHACVASSTVVSRMLRRRRLQATIDDIFDPGDFTLRADVTLTVDPVGAGGVFACTCISEPPSHPPPLPPPSPPPPSPPPLSPPPPSPPPPIEIQFGDGSNATRIPEKEDVIVVFAQSGSVGACDHVAFVSKEYADSHPGDECASAHTWPTVLNNDENFDRGGLVESVNGVNQTTIHLLNSGPDSGSIYDPSTWSPTGTFFLCHTIGRSCDAGPPNGTSYVFSDDISVHTHDHPPSAPPPPLAPPAGPPPPTSPHFGKLDCNTFTTEACPDTHVVACRDGNTTDGVYRPIYVRDGDDRGESPFFGSKGWDAVSAGTVGVISGRVKTTVTIIRAYAHLASRWAYFYHSDVDTTTTNGVPSSHFNLLLADGTVHLGALTTDGCHSPPPAAPYNTPARPPIPPTPPPPNAPDSHCDEAAAEALGAFAVASCRQMVADTYPTYTFIVYPDGLTMGYCGVNHSSKEGYFLNTKFYCDTNTYYDLNCVCPKVHSA
jgi:hypothetical protein